MNNTTCVIRILDEVNCEINGLIPAHTKQLYDEYGVYAPGYKHTPKYKLGVWDGQIRFFSKMGKTSVYLLQTIVPTLVKLGYTITIQDNRTQTSISPDPIDEHFFANRGVINPDQQIAWTMRPYQVELVNALLKNNGGVGLAGTGAGKAQPLDANVLTSTGWCPMGQITTGTLVVTPRGKLAKVLGVFPQGKQDVYEVVFHDGARTRCELNHLWEVNIKSHNGVNRKLLKTSEVMELLASHNDVEVSIPLIDCHILSNQRQHTAAYDFGTQCGRDTSLDISDEYVRGSVTQRHQFLKGLLDVVGKLNAQGDILFTVATLNVAKAIQQIVWSLGGLCLIDNTSGRNIECTIQYAFPTEIISHKPSQYVPIPKSQLVRKFKSITKISHELTQCILIDDDDHLYITDDYIVTHNTSMCAALALSYELAGDLKSIIIVPDKNLTEQTRREYEFFGVDVGEYSGSRKTLNHRHIVSTWQALKNNPKVIQDFDVVIVDECHGLRGPSLLSLLNDHGKNIRYRFGVTGTLPKEAADVTAVHLSVGDVQYSIPAHELIDAGYLAQLQINVIQHTIDLTNQYQLYVQDCIDSNVPKREICTYNKFKETAFPEWSAEKQHLQTNKHRLEWIAEYVAKLSESKKGNVLCLVNGIQFGKNLCKQIDGAIFLHGSDAMSVRRDVYEKFKSEDNLIVIATVNIASTGLDIKRIFNLVIIDGGKSFIRTIQSIGRGLRKAQDKDTVVVTDICSDLRYSKKHLANRIKYYNEAKYPYTRTRVEL